MGVSTHYTIQYTILHTNFLFLQPTITNPKHNQWKSINIQDEITSMIDLIVPLTHETIR